MIVNTINRESKLSSVFKMYLLPIMYKKCTTFEDFQTRERKINNLLIRKEFPVCGTFIDYRIIGFTYKDTNDLKLKEHYFTSEELRFLYSFFKNSKLNKNRVKFDWFFRPWKISKQ